MFQDAIVCSRWEICTRIAGNCDSAWLYIMMEMSMAATGADQIPAIGFAQADDLHARV